MTYIKNICQVYFIVYGVSIKGLVYSEFTLAGIVLPQTDTVVFKPIHQGGGILSRTIYKVVSPLMGTFYQSPDPDADPFVQEGQKVKPGEVVCVIESMKIFTELRTEQAGTVARILVENEEAVMKNQALIEIEVDS